MIVIDDKSKRIIDGFHRSRAYKKVYGDKFKMNMICRAYGNEKDMLLDAMTFNSSHGRRLSPFDQARCIQMGDDLKIDESLIAHALHMRIEKVAEMKIRRMAIVQDGAELSVNPRFRPIKTCIRHMAGKQMTTEQWDANEKLGGNNASFYVNCLISLIETDLIDMENENLLNGLMKLSKLLNNFKAKAG